MKLVSPGGSIAVRLGEVFGVSRPEHGGSGYRASVSTPPGITHLGTDRVPPSGFSGAPKAIERLRCERMGRHVVEIVEGRPWETARAHAVVHVDCT